MTQQGSALFAPDVTWLRMRLEGDRTGLGLPLTKALVEANHATFAIESQVS